MLREASQYSAELASELMRFFAFKWNVQRGIDNNGETDYGTLNYPLLEKLCRLFQGREWRHPIADLPALPETEEKFFAEHVPSAEMLSKAAADGIDGSASAASQETPGSNSEFLTNYPFYY